MCFPHNTSLSLGKLQSFIRCLCRISTVAFTHSFPTPCHNVLNNLHSTHSSGTVFVKVTNYILDLILGDISQSVPYLISQKHLKWLPNHPVLPSALVGLLWPLSLLKCFLSIARLTGFLFTHSNFLFLTLCFLFIPIASVTINVLMTFNIYCAFYGLFPRLRALI